MPNFTNILNSLLQISSTPVIRRFFILLCILSRFLLYGSDSSAQVSGGFQFDRLDKIEIQRNKGKTLRDQGTLRENRLVRYEILLEKMKKIRLKTQKLMREISMAMRGETLKLKSKLEKLQGEIIKINQEIVADLQKVNEDFLEGRENIRRKLESMRKESKSLESEIAFILEYEREIWQKETENLQNSLLQAKVEPTGTQSKSGVMFKSSRSTNKNFGTDKMITVNDPKENSVVIIPEYKHNLEKSKRGYKKASERKDDNKTLPKNRFERTVDNSQNEPKGDYDEGTQGSKGSLKSLKDESAEKPLQKNENILEKEEEKGTPKATIEEQKQKLFDFGNQIKILRKRVKVKNGNASKEFIELGNKYLETQRFIDSQDSLKKLTLLKFSNQKNLYLGSYEQATWAFKIALSFNRNKGETHLAIGKIYDEISDGENAIMYARLAHLVFSKKKNKAKMQETQSFIESLEKNYATRLNK